MPKSLILFSSANGQGNTFQLTQQIISQLPSQQYKFVSLDTLNFADYNYQNQYQRDDFYDLAAALEWADNIVFASPVYWHAVTANMKRFVDRMTELTENPEVKPIGKGLKDKTGFVLTTSASEQMCEIFGGFFERLFNYFDIQHGGALHVNCRDGLNVSSQELNNFTTRLRA